MYHVSNNKMADGNFVVHIGHTHGADLKSSTQQNVFALDPDVTF